MHLHQFLRDVCNRQNRTFSINVSCGYVLRHTRSNKCIYYRSFNTALSNTNELLDRPMIIAHRSRIPELLDLVTTQAVEDMAMLSRPDSEFRCEGMCIACVGLAALPAYQHVTKKFFNVLGVLNITCHVNHLDGLLLGSDGKAFIDFECGDDSDDDDDTELSQSDDEDSAAPKKRGQQILRDCLSYGKNWCVFYALAYLTWHCEKWEHVAKLKQQGRKICKDSLGPYARFYSNRQTDRTKKLFETFQERYPAMTENFIGVTFKMLPHIESTFNCRINLYTKTCCVGKDGRPGDGEFFRGLVLV